MRRYSATLTQVRWLTAADGGEDGDLVVVVERGGVAVEGLVAVDPDPGVRQDGGELGSVGGAGGVEELAEGGGVELVAGPAGGLAGLREQADPDRQDVVPSMSVLAMFVLAMLVRAAGRASRRAGSIGSPLTSSIP